jgi:ribosomal protein S18 acetylase RimI-like enzyme
MVDIESAAGRPEDVESALRLMYGVESGQFSPAAGRCRLALAAGEVSFLVARRKGVIVGTMLYREMGGALAILFPPHAVPGLEQAAVEDSLVRTAVGQLYRQGVKLCQALVEPAEAAAGCWLRNGFLRMGTLQALSRHTGPLPDGGIRRRLTFVPFSRVERAVFARTLELTYEDSLDSPELCGVRSVEEELRGHESQPGHDPSRWWLALERGHPVGVLLTASRGRDEWDLVYMGLVKAARGQGLGKELVEQALAEARGSGARRLFLTVDARNAPARAVYRSVGFESCSEQAVFLWVAPQAEQ